MNRFIQYAKLKCGLLQYHYVNFFIQYLKRDKKEENFINLKYQKQSFSVASLHVFLILNGIVLKCLSSTLGAFCILLLKNIFNPIKRYSFLNCRQICLVIND